MSHTHVSRKHPASSPSREIRDIDPQLQHAYLNHPHPAPHRPSLGLRVAPPLGARGNWTGLARRHDPIAGGPRNDASAPAHVVRLHQSDERARRQGGPQGLRRLLGAALHQGAGDGSARLPPPLGTRRRHGHGPPLPRARGSVHGMADPARERERHLQRADPRRVDTGGASKAHRSGVLFLLPWRAGRTRAAGHADGERAGESAREDRGTVARAADGTGAPAETFLERTGGDCEDGARLSWQCHDGRSLWTPDHRVELGAFLLGQGDVGRSRWTRGNRIDTRVFLLGQGKTLS
mmetsp:Transcript_36338/g.81721  ORF Transcript_36338/g.81721 Transcript_36338/m.81721 type:complete len:293 (+) Transcript_36338:1-879(+)